LVTFSKAEAVATSLRLGKQAVEVTSRLGDRCPLRDKAVPVA
jgi:hypothetical protein